MNASTEIPFCFADRKSTSGMRQSRPVLEFEATSYFKFATCQVQEVDGQYRPVTLHQHKQHASTIVLDFGGDEYEGLEGDYSFVDKQLRDGDGSLIEYIDLSMCSMLPRQAPPISLQPQPFSLRQPSLRTDKDKLVVQHAHQHTKSVPHACV